MESNIDKSTLDEETVKYIEGLEGVVADFLWGIEDGSIVEVEKDHREVDLSNADPAVREMIEEQDAQIAALTATVETLALRLGKKIAESRKLLAESRKLIVEWDTNSNNVDNPSNPAIMVITPEGTRLINDHELAQQQIDEAEQQGKKLDGLLSVTRWFVGAGRNTFIRILEGERWD